MKIQNDFEELLSSLETQINNEDEDAVKDFLRGMQSRINIEAIRLDSFITISGLKKKLYNKKGTSK